MSKHSAAKPSFSTKAEQAVAKFGTDAPMKRALQPEEIAPAFVFIAASSCSSYITGEIPPIIGGYSAGRDQKPAARRPMSTVLFAPLLPR